MPWKEWDYMTERMSFVTRLGEGERMTDLCREFGISRKTGYKIYNRWREFGVDGLTNQSRKAHRCTHKLPDAVCEALLEIKKEYPL